MNTPHQTISCQLFSLGRISLNYLNSFVMDKRILSSALFFPVPLPLWVGAARLCVPSEPCWAGRALGALAVCWFCCCDPQGTPIWCMLLSASAMSFTSWPTCPRTARPSRGGCSARRRAPSPFLAPTPRMGPPWKGHVLLPLLSQGH